MVAPTQLATAKMVDSRVDVSPVVGSVVSAGTRKVMAPIAAAVTETQRTPRQVATMTQP